MLFTKNLFNKETIEVINEQVKNLLLNKKVLDDNEDKYIHGTEYDLTTLQEIKDVKTLIEEVCSSIYGQPLLSHNYWVSVSVPGSTVIDHHHADNVDTVFSAVLYTQAETECGNLLFKDIGGICYTRRGSSSLFSIRLYTFGNCK